MSKAGNTYPCAISLNDTMVKVHKQQSGSNVRYSLTYSPEELEWAPKPPVQKDTVKYYLDCYRLGIKKGPKYLERNMKEYCDICSNKPDDMEQKDWCLGFRDVCRITAKDISRESVCQQVKKPTAVSAKSMPEGTNGKSEFTTFASEAIPPRSFCITIRLTANGTANGSINTFPESTGSIEVPVASARAWWKR